MSKQTADKQTEELTTDFWIRNKELRLKQEEQQCWRDVQEAQY